MNIKNRSFSVLVSVLVSFFLVSGITYAASVDVKSKLGGDDGDFFDFGSSTIRVGSIRVGSQDVGGVTFFNGTIVNDTTTYGIDNPVTISDNLRVDGGIQRGHNFSTDVWGVKILDSMTVYGDLVVQDDASVGGDLTVAGSFNSSDADAKYASKADTYTKSETYSKTETYSQTEVDNLVNPKADKTYVDSQDATKANSSDVYTKTQADSQFVEAARTDILSIAGSAFMPVNSTLTYTKQQTSGVLEPQDAPGTLSQFVVPIHLPDESTINRIAHFYTDGNVTYDVGISLLSRAHTADSASGVNEHFQGENESSGADVFYDSISVSSDLNIFMNNDLNEYFMLVNLQGGTDMTFKGVKIYYTHPN